MAAYLPYQRKRRDYEGVGALDHVAEHWVRQCHRGGPNANTICWARIQPQTEQGIGAEAVGSPVIRQAADA